MRLIDADAIPENEMNYPAWVCLRKQPTIDAEPVKHGRWIHTDAAASWDAKDECSVCHYATVDRINLSHFNYCPNCGAKMDLEES